jgi:hypothetical protein
MSKPSFFSTTLSLLGNPHLFKCSQPKNIGSKKQFVSYEAIFPAAESVADTSIVKLRN